MHTLYQYKSQVLQSNSYVYNLYCLYVRLSVGKDSEYIYTQ